MDKTKISSKLTELRKAKKETQEEVANAVGVSVSALAMYESGQRIPRDEIKLALSRHYGKTVQAIFFDK